MKKSFILLIFSFIMLFSMSIYASEGTDALLPNILKSEIVDGNITITVETEKDLIMFQEWAKQNNETVEKLWKQAELREVDINEISSQTNYLRASSLKQSTTLYKSSAWHVVPDWRIGYYCTYYDNSGRISSVSKVYAFGVPPILGTATIGNLEYDVRIIDAYRTIASNVSCLVNVESAGGLITRVPVSAYMEWYVGGGGNIY